MSKTVDERVVSMQFDNKNFEKNVSTSMSTLEKLKQKLSFKGATKGLENIDKAAKKVNMSSLSDSVDTVGVRFSSLQVIATTALANITNSAVNTAKRMASAFTLDPIIDGMREYETQLNSVQTILANTQHEGTNIDIVNKALDELNTYADKTIYNFSEMTRNIGTFTAAGVSLDKSVDAIKGIANLAAVSGSSSQQASTAMYQLSQALATGRVSLMDWNSVVNAGMGGKVFQDALKRTATQMGTNVDALIKKYGSFRESLTEGGWLTSDVLTETLKQFAGAYSEADLIQQGYSESQAKEIVKMAKTAEDAATKVKTFTQLIDTTKEALGSGWAQTWRLVFGDFEQAKELWTGISDVVSGFINRTSEARNTLLEGALTSNLEKMQTNLDKVGVSSDKLEASLSKTLKGKGYDVDALTEKYGSLAEAFKEGAVPASLLTETLGKLKEESLKGADGLKMTKEEAQSLWKEIDTLSQSVTKLGGRELLIDSFKNIFEGLASAVKPVSEAFREIFPPTTSEQLYKAIESFHNLTENFKLSETSANNLKRTFKGLFSILDIGKKAVTAVLDPLGDFLFGGSVGSLLDTFLAITGSIGDLFTNLNKGLEAGKGFSAISDAIGGVLGVVSDAISAITGGVGSLGEGLSKIGTKISDVFNGIMDVASNVIGWFRENIDSSDIFAGLAGGGIFVLLKNLAGLFKQAKDLLGGGLKGILFGNEDDDAKSIVAKFSSVLDGVHGSLSAFTTGLNVMSLVGIAGAIMMLSSSLRTISNIEPAKIGYSVAAIAAMMGVLNRGFKTMSKTLIKFNAKGTIKAGIAMMAMAQAINILANAMTKISELSWIGLAKGLIGVAGSLLILSGAFAIISRSGSVNLRTSLSILAIAKTCVMLSDALEGFGALSWSEIGRGLTAMGGALLELSGTLAIMSKAGGFGSLLGSIGLLIAVQALDEISEALEKLGGLSWTEIGKGLTAMGGALTEFTIALSALSKVGGFGSILGGGAILIAVQSLDEISENLKRLGSMSWTEIGKGLTAMGGALTELSVAAGALGKLAGFSGILGGTSIVIVVQALDEISENLERLGSMAWSEIGKGLSAMGGALAELSISAGALGKLAGFSGILGSMSIVIVVQALDEISESLEKLGSLSWSKIGKGLAAMGGALAESGLAAGLTGLAGLKGIIGGGSILITVQGLMDIAKALQEFGTMSWSEIGRGLTAMGGALGETGLASALTGLAGISGIIGGGTILITAQGLMDIAKALQEFGSMDWDEIGRGLTAMGGALAETALGGLLNTLSGLGAFSISAIAEPLGVLADSVKKWADVEIPEGLGEKMGTLAEGVNAFTWSLLGGLSISPISTSLGQLADSVKKWKGVTVPEGLGDGLESIAKGVNSFGILSDWRVDDIAEPLGGIADAVRKWQGVTVPSDLGDGLKSIADGINNFAILSDWKIDDLAEPLGGIAEGIKKWSGITVPKDFAENLEIISKGINNFAILSDWKIDDLAEPLGGMADAIRKWDGVEVPKDIGESLTSISKGINSFAILADWKIDDIAEPLGGIADAVRKWDGVKVSGDVGEGLKIIANGINNFAILSDWKIDDIAEPLGGIADAVNKWNGLKVSEDVGDSLKIISDGINNFAILSDWKIDDIGERLGKIADAVRKWDGLSVDPGIGDTLKSISKGVNSFGILSDWRIDDVAGPIGDIGTALSKWTGVYISPSVFENIPTMVNSFASFQNVDWLSISGDTVTTGIDNIKKLIDTIQSMSSINTGNVTTFSGAIDALGKISLDGLSETLGTETSKVQTAVTNLLNTAASSLNSGLGVIKSAANAAGRNIAASIGSGLQEGSTNISTIMTTIVTSISANLAAQPLVFQSAGASIGNSLANGITSSISEIPTKISGTIASIATNIGGQSSSFSSAGSSLMSAFSSGVDAGKSQSKSSMGSIITEMLNSISDKQSSFKSSATLLMTSFSTGIIQKSSTVVASVKTLMSLSIVSLSAYYSSFYSAGANLARGFANGISANSYLAAAKARAMASAAAEAARKALDEHSPSKVMYKIGDFAGKGFVNALSDYVSVSNKAGSNMAESAMSGLRDTLSALGSAIDSDIDVNPTIRPVLDMSDVRSGIGIINGLSGLSPSMSLLADVRSINSSMNQRGQNGSNRDVVSELRKLRSGIKDMPRNSYTVNGVTYDDGSATADAVGALIRAARIERRV